MAHGHDTQRARAVRVRDPATGEERTEYVLVNFCRWCGVEIVWATTQRGRRMPVNAEPDLESGTVQLDGKKVVRVFPEWRAAGMRDDGFVLHSAHFDTCPKWIAKRKKAKPKPVVEPMAPEPVPDPKPPTLFDR